MNNAIEIGVRHFFSTWALFRGGVNTDGHPKPHHMYTVYTSQMETLFMYSCRETLPPVSVPASYNPIPVVPYIP